MRRVVTEEMCQQNLSSKERVAPCGQCSVCVWCVVCDSCWVWCGEGREGGRMMMLPKTCSFLSFSNLVVTIHKQPNTHTTHTYKDRAPILLSWPSVCTVLLL